VESRFNPGGHSRVQIQFYGVPPPPVPFPLPPELLVVAAETEFVMVSNAFPMACDKDLVDAISINAIRSSKRTYSTKSCPL
jgi:hypothetical protein